MKLSKAVLAASGIGLSTQFSFGSITVSWKASKLRNWNKLDFRIWSADQKDQGWLNTTSFKMVRNVDVNAAVENHQHFQIYNGIFFSWLIRQHVLTGKSSNKLVFKQPRRGTDGSWVRNPRWQSYRLRWILIFEDFKRYIKYVRNKVESVISELSKASV